MCILVAGAGTVLVAHITLCTLSLSLVEHDRVVLELPFGIVVFLPSVLLLAPFEVSFALTFLERLHGHQIALWPLEYLSNEVR